MNPIGKVVGALKHFPWQRFAVSIIGGITIWLFLMTHRQWVWSFFESMMLMPKPSAELTSVAIAAMNSDTQVTMLCVTLIGAVVIFFITGNAALLANMFKFSSAAQAINTITSAAESRTETSDETIREFNTPELQERYGDQ